MSRRIAVSRALVAASASLFAAFLLAACGGGSGDDAWSVEALAKAKSDIDVLVINSQPVAGPTRLAFGLIAKDGGLVQDATGTVRLYLLSGDTAQEAAGEHPLTAVSLREGPDHAHAAGAPAQHNHDPLATMYIAHVELQGAGDWGADLAVRAGGKQYEHLRVRFVVYATSPVPAIGQPIPRTKQPVLRDVANIAEIDSSIPPRPELHTLTVADALDAGKPTLVAFATPAFCQTRFCGPVVENVVGPLAKNYAGRASFVHIEPYNLAEARKGKLVPIKEMAEWGLASEPYLFLIGADGRVVAQFEGIVEYEEVARELDKLLAKPAAPAGTAPAPRP